MKVRDLIKKLESEDQDSEALIYIREVEEFGTADGVGKFVPGRAFYSKTGEPKIGPAIVIHGWPTPG